MSKLIFLDVDGTLVDYETRIPRSAVKAIREARSNGHRVYICTGRSKAEVYKELWEIGLDGMIGGNGNYVEDRGHVVMHQLITKDQCRRIVDYFHKMGLAFYLESNNGLFASRDFAEQAQPAIREYTRRKGEENADQITISDVYPDMVFGGELYRDDLNKVSYVLRSYQDFLDTKEEFPDMENSTWGGAGATALFGDLGVKGITKGNAVEHLLEYLGMEKKDTIAFGDAPIDIPMFQCCGTSVAMGNGSGEVKRAADFVTDDVEQDGLLKAFCRLGLIG